MTPAQLRLLREQKGMTRDQLADHLKQSASAITKWEHNERPIPEWVAERMLSEVEITLPLKEMQQLYDLGTKLGKSFEEMLKMAIRAVLTQPPPADPKPIKPGTGLNEEARTYGISVPADVARRAKQARKDTAADT